MAILTRSMRRQSECDGDDDEVFSSSGVSSTSTSSDDDEEDEDVDDEVGTLLESLREMYPNNTILTNERFLDCVTNVGSLNPDITDILLSEHIKDKHKVRLCELYIVMMNYGLFTIEYIELRGVVEALIRGLRNRIRQAATRTLDPADPVMQQRITEYKHLKWCAETQSTKDKIICLDAPVAVRACIYRKYKELLSYEMDNSEYPKLNAWLEYALQIPYSVLRPVGGDGARGDMSQFLAHTYRKLNDEFFGLENVKEQILLYLSAKITNPAAKHFSLGLVGSKGVGKCFAKDTRVLMHSGRVANVQDIVVGDKVMGPDGQPRIVRHTLKGHDAMYEVRQTRGMTYRVCKGHLLVLKCVRQVHFLYRGLPRYRHVAGSLPGDVVTVPVETFCKWQRSVQKCFVGIHSQAGTMGAGAGGGMLARMMTLVSGAAAVSAPIGSIDPYLLGMWLGSGCPRAIRFVVRTTCESMNTVLRDYAAAYHSELRVVSEFYNRRVYTFRAADPVFSLKRKLTEMGVWGNISVPAAYIPAHSVPLSARRKLVAGFLDMAAVYMNTTNVMVICCVADSTSSQFIDDMVVLMSSVGLQCKITSNRVFMHITGDFTNFPLLVNAPADAEAAMAVSLNTVAVTPAVVKKDYYYGFECDGDHQFLLADYTVVHNCFAVDTMVRMYDGSVRPVQDVRRADRLMGDDGSPRVVVSTTAGDDCMYRIRQARGCEYIVNSAHILSLVTPDGEPVDMTVGEYLGTRGSRLLRGYRQSRARCRRVRDETRHECWMAGQRMYWVPGFAELCMDDLMRAQAAWVVAGFLAEVTDMAELARADAWFEYINVDVRAMLEEHGMGLRMVRELLLLGGSDDLEPYGFRTDIDVTPCGRGRYYGFTLCETGRNRRFLLQDGTVVHNTHISRTIAEILEFPFEQISMGGVADPYFLTGHDYTYTGSKPGAMVEALVSMKCRNGIVLFDEFDKVQDERVTNTLLHVIDPVQNKAFVDHYMGQDLKIDLSNLWLIFAMNEPPTSGPLKDRMMCIHIDGYKLDEKVAIACRYLLPRLCRQAGLKSDDITMDAALAEYMITRLDETEEDNKGVRYIERQIDNIVNKVMFNVNVNAVTDDDGLPKLSYYTPAIKAYPVALTEQDIDKFVFSAPYYRNAPNAAYTTMFL